MDDDDSAILLNVYDKIYVLGTIVLYIACSILVLYLALILMGKELAKNVLSVRPMTISGLVEQSIVNTR
jgi:hypothetical protein